MFDIFIKSFGVGVAIAAPVGPIGILCIRHTLAHGRGAGLASGFGAATADGVYGVIAAAGLAATGILLNHADTVRIVGACLLIYLGLTTARSFFRSAKTADLGEAPVRKRLAATFSATFALTLSNPMTILAFAAMISGLGTSAAATPSAPYFVVGGVFLGSALWWLFIVHVALYAKTRLDLRHTRWLDLISGAILLVWGLWLLISGWIGDGTGHVG